MVNARQLPTSSQAISIAVHLLFWRPACSTCILMQAPAKKGFSLPPTPRPLLHAHTHTINQEGARIIAEWSLPSVPNRHLMQNSQPTAVILPGIPRQMMVCMTHEAQFLSGCWQGSTGSCLLDFRKQCMHMHIATGGGHMTLDGEGPYLENIM